MNFFLRLYYNLRYGAPQNACPAPAVVSGICSLDAIVARHAQDTDALLRAQVALNESAAQNVRSAADKVVESILQTTLRVG